MKNPTPLVFLLLILLLTAGPFSSRAQEQQPVQTRPQLRFINGRAEMVEVYWLSQGGERIWQCDLTPGAGKTISTTGGHRFSIVGKASGTEEIATCAGVAVQAHRCGGVPKFYTQRVSAGGYPIVASARVNPYALKEAAHLVDLMLAKRPDLREALIRSGSQLCVMARNEYTTDHPDFAWMARRPVPGFDSIPPRDYWDARARGMGGSDTDPFCTCGEENLLGYPGDPYAEECILIHEFAHSIHRRGMAIVDPTFDGRLRAAYEAAMKAGRWRGKYAATNRDEYFAEGVQSWFDNNRVNDHDHNHVHLRAQLIEYDPALAALCREVFGETELKYTKPATRLPGHMAGYDPAKAPRFEWPERLRSAKVRMTRLMMKARAEAGSEPKA